jgi:hypothetical protein
VLVCPPNCMAVVKPSVFGSLRGQVGGVSVEGIVYLDLFIDSDDVECGGNLKTLQSPHCQNSSRVLTLPPRTTKQYELNTDWDIFTVTAQHYEFY